MMVMFQEDTAILNSDISHGAGVGERAGAPLTQSRGGEGARVHLTQQGWQKEQGCISHSRGGRRSRGASHTAGAAEGAGTHRKTPMR